MKNQKQTHRQMEKTGIKPVASHPGKAVALTPRASKCNPAKQWKEAMAEFFNLPTILVPLHPRHPLERIHE